MVLNALQINPPFDPIYSPYTIFTQDNIFTAAVLKALPFYKVRAMGMTLHELAKLLAVFDLKTEIFYADQVSVEQFKKLAIQAVSDPKQAILVNFLRTQLQQRGDGHISPLAAYNSKSDRFLLLDVAKFKYPAVWIKTIDLYQAMKTLDKETGKMRGFVIIQKHS